jgi:polysaccharide export outer membrane protein
MPGYIARHRICLRVIVTAGLVMSCSIGVTAQTVAQVSDASSVHNSPDTPKPQFQERDPRYRLRRGDTFDLDMSFSPEFNQTVAVQPDGYVTLKGIGSLHVEGQTIPQLTETIKAGYGKILHDPVIAVFLKDFEKPYFIAAGQVAKPGKYELRSALTVTQAIAIAGGFNDSAKHSQVVLFRPLPDGGFEANLLNIKQLLAERNLSEDMRLEPGDTLYVPQNTLSKIRKFIPSTSLGAYLNPQSY